MSVAFIWLLKLLLSHLLTDFVFQPKKWVEERTKRHFSSPRLYLHGLCTAFVPLLLIGFNFWLVAIVILITHILIDGWKSYQPATVAYFLADQLLHLVVILSCWAYIFASQTTIALGLRNINDHLYFWKVIVGMVFLTTPSGILIGQLTKRWRDKLPEGESLGNAGKWIGITERLIIFIFVINGQFGAIGLLVAAKGIIRFNEKDRQEIKTEYLVVGTLMSIALAVLTGWLISL